MDPTARFLVMIVRTFFFLDGRFGGWTPRPCRLYCRGHRNRSRWTCRYRVRGRRRGRRRQRRLRLLVVLDLHRPRLELHLESVSLSSKYYFDLVDGIASSMSRYYGGISLLWCSQNQSARVASPLPSAARFLRPTPPRLREEEERERRPRRSPSVTAARAPARARSTADNASSRRALWPACPSANLRAGRDYGHDDALRRSHHPRGRDSYGLIGRL